MSNARGALKQIEKWKVTKFWTGSTYVWDVPDLDENSNSSSLIFSSHADAVAYINALQAVVTAAQAAITVPKEVLEELDRIGCEQFWAKYEEEENL